MNIQKLRTSVLAYLQRLENAMDYDPIEAQGRRIAILERELDEISGRRRDSAGPREREAANCLQMKPSAVPRAGSGSTRAGGP